jgi:hypothetical protein
MAKFLEQMAKASRNYAGGVVNQHVHHHHSEVCELLVLLILEVCYDHHKCFYNEYTGMFFN